VLNQLTKIFKILDPEDNNVSVINSGGSETKGWEIVKDFNPLSWGLGIEFYGQTQPYIYPDSWISISIDLGPWLFTISKYWKATDDE